MEPGQVALVTGGGRGLGRVMAQALAAAGLRVAVAARSADELAETLRLMEEGQAWAAAGGPGLAVPADVTDPAAVARLVAEVESRLGPVSLLVNGAGILGGTGPMWEADPDAWWRGLEVNLRGPFLVTRAVLPAMIARGRGRVVNVASSLGLRGFAFASSYGVAKTALIRLTESLALELAGTGVHVFALMPGIVHTSLVDSATADRWVGPHFRRILEEGRDVPPEGAGKLVVRIAAGESDALSGRYIGVDDDLAELARRAAADAAHHTLRLRT